MKRFFSLPAPYCVVVLSLSYCCIVGDVGGFDAIQSEGKVSKHKKAPARSAN